MAIISSGIYPINPNVTDGTQLANYINELVTAINSNQASATRPPLITKGGVWTKLVNETDVDVMVYDGTTDFKVASIVNGEIIDVDGVPEAPIDGKQYARQDENWTEVNHPASNRNLIINGDMRIDQRNAGASQNNSEGSAFSADRWKFYGDQATKFSIQQQTSVVPNNFTHALAITSLSAYTVGNDELFQIYQNIEGYNIADLGWGTATAKTVTLSFWVQSSLTGTFGGSLKNSASNRSYPFTYTISNANTWEQKSITIAGDTTGTWATDNTTGIALNIGLGVGSTYSGTAGSWGSANYLSATGATSIVGTSGSTFYITGVQLEVGDTATPFEHRPYDLELQRCQRYYWKMTSSGQGTRFSVGMNNNTTDSSQVFFTPSVLRSQPSVGYSDITISQGLSHLTPTGIGVVRYGDGHLNLTFTVASGLTEGLLTQTRDTNYGAGYIYFDSEL